MFINHKTEMFSIGPSIEPIKWVPRFQKKSNSSKETIHNHNHLCQLLLNLVVHKLFLCTKYNNICKVDKENIVKVILNKGHVKPNKKNETVFLKLPMGEYRMNFKKMYNCNVMRQNNIHVNYNLIKIADDSKEVKGNVSLLMPIDDNLSIFNNHTIQQCLDFANSITVSLLLYIILGIR
ncbi:hypothetical protein QTP88_014869 [Uroleucon formosanum]